MAEIVPSVLCYDDESYKQTIASLEQFAKRAHIDLTDGVFAPTKTVTLDKIWWPTEWIVEIHAMVSKPSEYVDALIQMKPYMVTFHVEVAEDLTPIIKKLQVVGIKSGIALLKKTVPSSVAEYIKLADHVLVFSGDLGKPNGKASLMQLEKIRLIKRIRADVEIGWDGGASLNNVFSLTQGGVNIITCNSAINGTPNPAESYRKLVDEINKHGAI